METARKHSLQTLAGYLLVLVILSACSQTPSTATPALAATPEATATEAPIATSTSEPTPEPTPLASTMMLKIDPPTTEVIYDQARRSSVGQFWPDGNIAFIPDGDQFRFFAANGNIGQAVTLGSLDDPAAKVETRTLQIQGVDPQFKYAAGGSIYRDPETGMLIMFYHAERHFTADGICFHAATGMAVSNDEGKSFQDLGIILETNAAPDPQAPCSVDTKGAPYTIKDGMFYMYFQDKMENSDNVFLALATAPVAEVVEAAKIGNTSPWFKYFNGTQEPGLSGKSSPLELGNPIVDWMSVSYNTFLNKFIMAITFHPGESIYPGSLYLISSDDGINWSPRVPLILNCACELTYSTIVSLDGSPNTGNQFYVYYVTNPKGFNRWGNTALERMTVTVSGELVEAPHEWDFNSDGDTEGWTAFNQLSPFEVTGGHLVSQSTGNDPYFGSPSLAIDAQRYPVIEVNMKVPTGVTDEMQIFFTTDKSTGFDELDSIRLPIEGDGEFHTYTFYMTIRSGWKGIVTAIRIDPLSTPAADIEIDYIRFTKP